AAREVTLYLAVQSPSSSHPRSAGPVASCSMILHRARRRFPARPVQGPSEHHLRVPIRVEKLRSSCATESPTSIAQPIVSRYSAQLPVAAARGPPPTLARPPPSASPR